MARLAVEFRPGTTWNRGPTWRGIRTETPRIGRRVPELNDPDIREVPAHSWRVIYQLRAEAVFVVTLVHRRGAPTPEELRG